MKQFSTGMLLALLLLALPAIAQDTDQADAIAEPGDTPTTFENPDLVVQYLQTITAEDLASHLYLFASDFFEGRETSARGQKLAAHYLAAQYRKMGVMPMGTMETEDNALSPWTTGRFNKLRAFFGGDGAAPAGLLIVGDLSPRGESVALQAKAQAAASGQGVGSLSLDPPSGDGRRGRFPTVLTVSAELASALLGRDVAQVKAEIDQTLNPVVFESDIALTAEVSNKTGEVSSENVVAFIEGSDPMLKDEYVVISSHYDHVGMRAGEGDTIFNGADDDGSGTVTFLEIAEAFAKAKEDGFGPRRSVIFLNVSGEEKGLLGSRYYTDMDPIVPLEQTVTNLNIDMIGRIDPTHPDENTEYVYIIGSNLVSQELHDINIRSNETFGSKVQLHERFNSKDDPNQFYRRSDHWNFGKHNIPFIFFFTGTHDDYHGVDDEPDKIEYERMAKIAHVIFATAWQVANQDTRPVVSGTGFN
ncbi:MAG: M28 family peptidase [Bacteroidota bacterium]|nr:M28 family peptidase [Bacteroidota bacterium]